jgi:hypothetical protein
MGPGARAIAPHMFGYAVCVLCVIQANTMYGCCRCIPGVAVWYILCGYSHVVYGTVWLYAAWLMGVCCVCILATYVYVCHVCMQWLWMTSGNVGMAMFGRCAS